MKGPYLSAYKLMPITKPFLLLFFEKYTLVEGDINRKNYAAFQSTDRIFTSRRNKWRWAKAGPLPHNISLAKGPVHVAASRGFVDFLLHSTYSRDLLAWTARTAIPDETFFATLNNLHRLGVPGSYTGLYMGEGRQYTP